MLVSIASLFEQSPSDQVPSTLKHCMVAVGKKGKGARAAWNICRASQVRSGHLKGPYRRDAKLHQSVRQTQKGSRRTMKHSMERDAPEKNKEFDRLFKRIETGVTRNR